MPTLTVQEAREAAQKLDYRPSGSEAEARQLIQEDWIKAYSEKNMAEDFLQGVALEEFWRRCRNHYNGVLDEHYDEDDETQNWKARFFKKKSRHKVIAAVAQNIDSGIGIDFSAFNEKQQLDRAMAKVGEDLYEWSLAREDFDYKQLLMFIEAAVVGTVHVFEEIAYDTREIKDILDIDFETGAIKWEPKEVVDFKGPRGEIVPNDELYPGDRWTHEVQEQPFIIRRKVTSYQNARSAFEKYDNFKYVIPGSNYFLPLEGENAIDRAESAGEDEDVEIVWRWSKAEDSLLIVVNNVLLTPADNPLPYPHKSYPLAKLVFETFADPRFYWGDSLVNKNYDDQQIQNRIWNWMLDDTAIKRSPPIITNVPELAGTDMTMPGVVAGYEGDFKVATIPELTQGVSSSELNMMKMSEENSDENSSPAIVSGTQPNGTPTATQIDAMVGAAEKLKGFNSQFVAHFLIEFANLRVRNCLWFVTHDEDFRQIVMDKVKTVSGKEGRRKITFVQASELPTSDELWSVQTDLANRNTPVDFVFVDSDRVNDYRYHIEMSAIPKPKRTSAAKLSRQFQKYTTYLANPLQFDQRKNAEMLAQAFGDDPDEVLAKEQPVGAQPPGMPGQGGQGMPVGAAAAPPVDGALQKAMASNVAA